MNSKQFVLLAFAFGSVALTEAGVPIRDVNSNVPIARQVQTVENAVNDGVRNNFIGILSRVANASEIAGSNVSRAAALLIRGVVREGFNLGGVAAYLPRLLFLDGPNQFIETLRLVRSNQLRLPNDMDSAIDTLITFTGSVRDSGIPGNFAPVVEFFPNIFTGVERFVQEFLYSVFAFFAPIPSREVLDMKIQMQNIRVVPTSPASV